MMAKKLRAARAAARGHRAQAGAGLGRTSASPAEAAGTARGDGRPVLRRRRSNSTTHSVSIRNRIFSTLGPDTHAGDGRNETAGSGRTPSAIHTLITRLAPHRFRRSVMRSACVTLPMGAPGAAQTP